MKSIRKRICNYIATSTDLKNKISILLLLTLLVYISGSFVVYKYSQIQQKRAMKAFIAANPQTEIATRLSFSLHAITNHEISFEWKEKGEEFIYKNNLYDVVKCTIQNDSVYIIAINDNEENRLIENYTKLVNKQNNSKTNSQLLLKFFTTFFILDDVLFNKHKEIKVKHNYCYDSNFSNWFVAINTPPPQV